MPFVSFARRGLSHRTRETMTMSVARCDVIRVALQSSGTDSVADRDSSIASWVSVRMEVALFRSSASCAGVSLNRRLHLKRRAAPFDRRVFNACGLIVGLRARLTCARATPDIPFHHCRMRRVAVGALTIPRHLRSKAATWHLANRERIPLADSGILHLCQLSPT